MKLGNLLVFHAVVALAFGMVFMLVPSPSLSLYGVTLRPGGTLIAELVGVVYIGIGLLNWLAPNAAESEVL